MAASCGNGFVEDGEECDDDTPLCRSDCRLACQVEPGPVLTTPNGDEPFVALALDARPEGGAVVGGFLGAPPGEAFAVASVSTDGSLEAFRSQQDTPRGFSADLAVGSDGSFGFVASSTAGAVLVTGTTDLQEFSVANPVDSSLVGAGVGFGPDGSIRISGSIGGETGSLDVFVFHGDGVSVFDSGPLSYDLGGPLALSASGTSYVAGALPSASGLVGVPDPAIIGFDGENTEVLWTTELGSTNLDLNPEAMVVNGRGQLVALFNQRHSSDSSTHFLLVITEPDGTGAEHIDSNDLFRDARTGNGVAVDDSGRIYVVGSPLDGPEGLGGYLTALDGEQVLCDEQWIDYGAAFDVVRDRDGDLLLVSITTDWESRVLRARTLD